MIAVDESARTMRNDGEKKWAKKIKHSSKAYDYHHIS